MEYIDDEALSLNWQAEGDVSAYVVYVENEAGERRDLGVTADTGRTLPLSRLDPGMYTVHVGAIPVNGTEGDAAWSEVPFGIPAPTPTPSPTPPPVGEVSAPEIRLGSLSAHEEDGVEYIDDEALSLNWQAEGDVSAYAVYVENEAGERRSLGVTEDTGRTLPLSRLDPGVYTVHVGAIPVNGTEGDAAWSEVPFGIPAPTPTPPPTPTPTPSYVVFSSSIVEKAVRSALGKASDDIYPEELTRIEKLMIYFSDISDISDLAMLTQLKELYLSSNKISDLTPLSGLTGLEVLILISA